MTDADVDRFVRVVIVLSAILLVAIALGWGRP